MAEFKRFWLFDDPRSHGARAILRWAADGLNAIGGEARVFALDPGAADQAARMRDDLRAFRPDAVLLANHPASLFWTQLGVNRAPCESIVWLFDDPALMGDEFFSPHEIVLLSDPGFEEGAKRRGAERTLFVPVAAPDAIHAERDERFDAPVAYVGAAADLSGMRNNLSAETATYLDGIAERLAVDPSRSMNQLLEDYPIAPGKRVTLTGPLTYYLYAEANRRSRMRFLTPLAELGLRLYGNDVWKPVIQGTSLEGRFQGGIDPLTDYHRLIRSVRININLRSLQGFCAPTHRDFLIPRLGGFCIATPAKLASMEALDPEGRFGLERFVRAPESDTPEAMKDMARYYLSHPAEREAWIARSQAAVEREHLFSHRMRQLIDLLSTPR
ncbi:MAG: glycosyltransferase [bacterium]|nr:glycosyltransferase [bacterium]